MSILARAALEKNLETVRKQLGQASGNNEELKALEARLASERDPYVKALLQERVVRLRKAEKPNPYVQHHQALKTLEQQLQATLQTMQEIPWYSVAARGGKRTAGAPKKAGKRGRPRK
jgi:hypothetical protein